jgi:uncharacterized protein
MSAVPGRGMLVAGLAVAAGAGVWLLAAALPTAARLLTVMLVVALPVSSLEQGRMLREAELERIPRSGLYASTSLTLWLLAAATVGIAWWSGFSAAMLGIVMIPPLPLLAWSVALTLGGVLIVVGSRLLRLRETPFVHHLLPRTRGEKLAFVGVSVTAGVCEEVVFRGFLIAALSPVLGSAVAAALAASAVFGFLHGYQGVTGIVRTALLGFMLALPLLATGSILPAVIAHFAIDLVVGVWLADWLRGERLPTGAALPD